MTTDNNPLNSNLERRTMAEEHYSTVAAENMKNCKMSTDQVWKTDSSFDCNNKLADNERYLTALPTKDDQRPSKPKKERMTVAQRAAYSVGHVLNDLCASMWFTYLLLYFNLVLKFSNGKAGVLVLIGQVADAMATPFVGIASDNTNSMKICRYGRRKIWHLIGTVCTVISFPFLFIPCIGMESSDQSVQMIYYAVFIIIFQFGWASVQVAHLSLIPDLTKNPNEKTELNALRNAFTVVSSICVYSVAWVVLGVQSGTSDSAGIGPEDKDKFRLIMIIVVIIGTVFSIIFHLGINEPKPPPRIDAIAKAIVQQNVHSVEMNGQVAKTKAPKKNARDSSMTWKRWLKHFEFYKVAVLYMCTRLFVNLSQTYITLYLQESLKLPKNSVAIIPLVVYVSGLVASIFMKLLNKKAGRRVSFVLGVIFAIGFCIWIFLGGTSAGYATHQLYAVACLMGIGGTVMLVTCLSITADLIGDNVQSGAFVYGAMSFADKLSNGMVVVVVQGIHVAQPSFYRDTLAFGCGIPSVIALITVFALSSKLVNSTIAPTTGLDDKTQASVPAVTNGHVPACTKILDQSDKC